MSVHFVATLYILQYQQNINQTQPTKKNCENCIYCNTPERERPRPISTKIKMHIKVQCIKIYILWKGFRMFFLIIIVFMLLFYLPSLEAKRCGVLFFAFNQSRRDWIKRSASQTNADIHQFQMLYGAHKCVTISLFSANLAEKKIKLWRLLGCTSFLAPTTT